MIILLILEEILSMRQKENEISAVDNSILMEPSFISISIPTTQTSISESFPKDLATNKSMSFLQTCQFSRSKTPKKMILQKKISGKMRINQLEKQVMDLTNQLLFNDTTSLLALSEKHLPPSVYFIVKMYIDFKNKRKLDYRYNNELKQLALTIYFLGPKVYTFLKKILLLPNPCILKRVTQHFQLMPGLNDFLFNFINFKTKNFKPDDLECILCAGEMTLKTNLYYLIKNDEIIGFNQTKNIKTYEPTKHALVLMIRGINVNWKLPIAYFLVSNSCTGLELQDIIFSTISKLFNIGINVKAFVTDMGPNFFKFAEDVNVSPTRPFFLINDKKIIYIFDPPHILKATRNIFFQHVFKCGNELFDTKCLKLFFNQDRNSNPRAAPKLTNAHIFPNAAEKMRFDLAAQVFSHSVASGMSYYLANNNLPSISKPTIQFIDNMDKLFDIFNSTEKPNLKIHNRPFKKTNEQLTHLMLMSNFFKTLKVISKKNGKDVTNQMKFINGWLISISGLILLWDTINSNKTKNYVLYTNRINQDCLKNLFCTFRQQTSNNTYPTPIQFIHGFKKLFCLNYFKHSNNVNYIKDLDTILTQISTTSIENINTLFPNKTTFNMKKPNLQVSTVDYQTLSLPDQNYFSYICGYLMNKCLSRHTCDICLKYARTQNNLEPSFLLSYYKSYSNKKNSTIENPTMLHNDFYNYIFEMETLFIKLFPTLSVEIGVGEKIKFQINNIPFNHPCILFESQYLINLFVRFRIYTAIKFLNRHMVSEKKIKNRKLCILEHL